MSIKCRKCRCKIIDKEEFVFLDAHGERLDSTKVPACTAESLCFIEENSVPWISTAIEEGSWTKGKLNCPQCGARLGSFDFTSDTKCPCGLCVQPPVHIVKAKVDIKLPGVDVLLSAAKRSS